MVQQNLPQKNGAGYFIANPYFFIVLLKELFSRYMRLISSLGHNINCLKLSLFTLYIIFVMFLKRLKYKFKQLIINRLSLKCFAYFYKYDEICIETRLINIIIIAKTLYDRHFQSNKRSR
jgi:hypothetical protein